MRYSRDLLGKVTAVGVVLGAAIALAGLRRPAGKLAGRGRVAASNALARAKKATNGIVADARERTQQVIGGDDADRRPYEERTVKELYELAAEREISGRSGMNKAQLIDALREKQ